MVPLQIEKGKITSFIGPNGAGKSTLLSMISRLIAKDAGVVTMMLTKTSPKVKTGISLKKYRF